MRTLLIAFMLLSCGQGRFELEQVPVDQRVNVSVALSNIGWDIESSSDRRVATQWRRLRLYHSPSYVTEVQIRIVANLKRGTVIALCTQRTIRKDGVGEKWWFRPCSDPRALKIVDLTMRAVGKVSP